MFTSCCPDWVNLVEKSYPELMPHLSTCKSPQGMMGTLIKTYFAQKQNRTQLHTPGDHSEKKLTCPLGRWQVTVSVMPCVAKKDEHRSLRYQEAHRCHLLYVQDPPPTPHALSATFSPHPIRIWTMRTAIDERKQLRRSHENPAVQELYKTFLRGEPNSAEAHHLLHTHYTDRTSEVKSRSDEAFGVPPALELKPADHPHH